MATTSGLELLLLQLLPANCHDLLRSTHLTTLLLVVGLLLSTLALMAKNSMNVIWSLCETVTECVETASTGSASPPVPEQLPGPRGLPFIGYLPFLGKLPHLSLARVAQRYGGRAFRLLTGCRRYVVISRIETLRELARRYPQQLRGKPRTFTTEQMTLGAHNDLVQRWKRRRAYTESGLKMIEQTTLSGTVGIEVSRLINEFDRMAETATPVDVCHGVAMYAACTMYRVAYGRAPGPETITALSRLVDALPDYTTMIGSLSWFDALPFWRRFQSGCFQRFVDFNRAMSGFCRKAKEIRLFKNITENGTTSSTSTGSEAEDDDVSADDNYVRRTCHYKAGTTRSLFDFFRMRWNRMPLTEAAKFELTDEILFDGLEDVIRAGTESTTLTLKWFLLYAATFPHVQKRMQAEIADYLEHTGNDCQRGDCASQQTGNGRSNRKLNIDDLSNLPYCRAALTETLRFSSLNPFLKRELTDDVLLPAELDRDVEKEGDQKQCGDSTDQKEILLPRGTVLLYNTWAINNDPRNWTEPELFRPERFLREESEANGDKWIEFDETKMDLFAPFGFGRRRCVGVDIGKQVCLMAATSIIERFDIGLDPAGEGRSDLEPIYGIGVAPKSYRLVLSRRK